jgi:hypothetical protein
MVSDNGQAGGLGLLLQLHNFVRGVLCCANCDCSHEQLHILMACAAAVGGSVNGACCNQHVLVGVACMCADVGYFVTFTFQHLFAGGSGRLASSFVIGLHTVCE